ncbi:hypothetical protein TSAR_006378 [Trichomalopsis sarcophagae]|uniref:THAP-type domain-containing protein n=1 Tax=Trichomalopsis sarcophagae TaxID=543379 RepID=A0A232EVX0_9HYME|nr:hypothetical protein TSAR_006378 [Trichomalopsis sarcophagae]
MPICSVNCCKNSKNTKDCEIQFHRFPKDQQIRDHWIKACNRESLNLENARICSIHFNQNCYVKKPDHLIVPGDTNVFVLSKTAAPTLHISDARDGIREANKVASEEIPVDSSKIFVTSDLEAIQYVAIDSEDREKNCFQHENEHLKKENADLKSDIEALNTANTQLKKKNDDLIIEMNKMTKKMQMHDRMIQNQVKEKVYEILQPIFTIGQIKKLLNLKVNEKSIKWNSDDIATAIALRSVTPKGYRYLRKKNYPLPALSTLRKKVAEIMIEPGVLEEVLSVMK